MEKIKGKQELLLESLKKFYVSNDTGVISIIIPIIKQQTTISLRLLDWLVTNYSKQNDINYNVGPEGSEGSNFNIWLDYKNQLKAYSKRQFDPFCRRERIWYDTKTGQTSIINFNDIEMYQKRTNGFITTVGQLNFFKWALSNLVVNYAFLHITEIESDMLKSADLRKIESMKKKVLKNGDSSSIVRKRKVSKNHKGLHKHIVKVVIKFS